MHPAAADLNLLLREIRAVVREELRAVLHGAECALDRKQAGLLQALRGVFEEEAFTSAEVLEVARLEFGRRAELAAALEALGSGHDARRLGFVLAGIARVKAGGQALRLEAAGREAGSRLWRVAMERKGK